MISVSRKVTKSPLSFGLPCWILFWKQMNNIFVNNWWRPSRTKRNTISSHLNENIFFRWVRREEVIHIRRDFTSELWRLFAWTEERRIHTKWKQIVWNVNKKLRIVSVRFAIPWKDQMNQQPIRSQIRNKEMCGSPERKRRTEKFTAEVRPRFCRIL